jgi:hypothetical protein
MTKKEALVEALRICTGMINAGIDLEDEFSETDTDKIHKAMSGIAASLERRAVKLGGEFNPFTGMEQGRIITINPLR